MMPYNARPNYPLAEGELASGFGSFAEKLFEHSRRIWLIDGMSGVDWSALHSGLQAALGGHQVAFFDIKGARLKPEEVKPLLTKWMGDDNSAFGRLYPGELSDFFDLEVLNALRNQAITEAEKAEIVICYGQGSSLLSLEASLAWIDLPKQTIRELAYSGQDVLLGTPSYPPNKCIPCLDWPLMKRNKISLFPTLDLYIDMGQPEYPILVKGAALRSTLTALSRQPFRVKPIFYTTLWGGQWLKHHMELEQKRQNYGGSYELVASENNIVLHDGGLQIEVPFEVLIAQESVNIQGSKTTNQFGTEFPLRLNLTDTMGGGNLSCQVHPIPEYTLHEFGHQYVEHETYYVLASEPDSLIYLGLKEIADAIAFRRSAERARDEGVEFDIGHYVEAWPTRAHEVFHVPAGTIHNIGANNLVLEIISNPFVHTFRVYDYMRKDVRGKMRPVHIETAWKNIDFNRRTDWVRRNLLSSPSPLRKGKDWIEYIFPGPQYLQYAVTRVEFSDTFSDDTGNRHFHILNMIEGEHIIIEWGDEAHPLHYAETILIPAAVGSYTLHNRSPGICKLVKAYMI